MSVQDLNDCYPEFTEDYSSNLYSVSENDTEGTIVATITAEDNDVTELFKRVTYRPIDISYPFKIDEASGVITVSYEDGQTPLDFETTPSYSFTITATDNESKFKLKPK